MSRLTWDYITLTAPKCFRSWSNKVVIDFHYFNPNGLYAEWNSMCNTLSQYIDAGTIPSGWHIAYGSLSYFHADQVSKLAMQKGRVNSINLEVTLEGLQNAIDKGYNKLGEFLMEE